MNFNIKHIKIRVVFAFLAICLAIHMNAQNTPTTFKNPILSGYHPDPSIIRVEDDYYLVNSTFIWYPGIPIYHSKDLVNWKLIGHGIHRENQVNFDGLAHNKGIYALTIRYNEGLFYLITTCVNCEGNFYITAKNPAGPWSDPIWLKDAPGIDPSLMWDQGKCYYIGQNLTSEQEWPSQCQIYLQELDLKQQKLVGERTVLSNGHANNAVWAEGPHVYKIKDKYMLLISEGGTSTHHSITVHHSDSLRGPYISDLINPVITHRHLGKKAPIQAVGHGDIVETQNGEWWAVALAKRSLHGHTTLGRETFLAKVEFEGKTPIFNDGKGKILTEQKRPDLPWTPFEKESEKDEFKDDVLNLKWCFIRIPKKKFYDIKDEQLAIQLRPETLDSLVNSSLILQRIKHHKFKATTKLSFDSSKKNEQAGLTIYRTNNNNNNYLLLKEKDELILIQKDKGVKTEIARIPCNKSKVYLRAVGTDLNVQFYYGETLDAMNPIGSNQSLTTIADENGLMFNGPGIGMYATSNGKKSTKKANFDWFEYTNSKF